MEPKDKTDEELNAIAETIINNLRKERLYFNDSFTVIWALLSKAIGTLPDNEYRQKLIQAVIKNLKEHLKNET